MHLTYLWVLTVFGFPFQDDLEDATSPTRTNLGIIIIELGYGLPENDQVPSSQQMFCFVRGQSI